MYPPRRFYENESRHPTPQPARHSTYQAIALPSALARVDPSPHFRPRHNDLQSVLSADSPSSYHYDPTSSVFYRPGVGPNEQFGTSLKYEGTKPAQGQYDPYQGLEYGFQIPQNQYRQSDLDDGRHEYKNLTPHQARDTRVRTDALGPPPPTRSTPSSYEHTSGPRLNGLSAQNHVSVAPRSKSKVDPDEVVPFGPPPGRFWKPAPVHALPRITVSKPRPVPKPKQPIRQPGVAVDRQPHNNISASTVTPRSINQTPRPAPSTCIPRSISTHPGPVLATNPALERYHTLSAEAFTDHLIFRVHSSSSFSPLIWTGSPDTSGFFAPDPVFVHLTPGAYRKSYGGLGTESWGMGSWIRGMMVDHILNRPIYPLKDQISRLPFGGGRGRGNGMSSIRGRGLGLRGPHGRIVPPVQSEIEASCWISTTRSLDWAIYEIARQLSLNDQGSASLPGEKTLRLAVIRYDPQVGRSSDGSVQVHSRELRLIPYFYLAEAEGGIISSVKKEMSIEARRRTNDTFETLYWGRVFSQSIEEDLVFTRESLPFMLPGRFWRPSWQVQRRTTTSSWLDRLRWDPRVDIWETAQRKMRDQYGASTHWTDQPIHNYSSKWPRKDVIETKQPDRGRAASGGVETESPYQVGGGTSLAHWSKATNGPSGRLRLDVLTVLTAEGEETLLGMNANPHSLL
ncbi:hypothetical protein CI109_101549 [Kwoniella shandongensis]|uniref:Uncharacterized protein n=1 Tax=Kwoniella shandongensis TaxID=1734106 RepID=A0A5M6CAP5_9TREE|nr:uncharacterized protein CI109_001319 [Kwoniella shandongensis]KAA5530515.1 hypothetical protein CI109_001319 [Kwoniella shandongensis]